MTDTTTTEGVVLTKDYRIKAFNWLYGLAGDEGHERVSILEEYVSVLEEGIETLTADLERVEGETARYREALEDARHSLVRLNGLWATDRGISERRGRR